MKAVVYEKYGSSDVLQFREVEKPAPKNNELPRRKRTGYPHEDLSYHAASGGVSDPLRNEVLIKVHAASINYVDWQVLTGKSLLLRLMTGGLLKPKHKILGDDLAGRVEAVGVNVKQFRPGDEVFGIGNFALLLNMPVFPKMY